MPLQSMAIVVGPKKIEDEDIDNIWYQQDGAKCHTAETTLGAAI